ncbi:DUF6514 family protein [uncultured Ruthenibacterium sp.]|uniref:DUF6514 family protein n=1 Tax=uncultured Ruthenibacterium sp. TaxID=1905347 RepID=UPI00349E64E1
MESGTIVFERTLSELEPLQSSSTLRYVLDDVKNGSKRYGVKITQSIRDCVYEARCGMLCTTKNQCYRLLRFLYENAVTPVHLEDIIQDICNQGLLEGLEQTNECE